MSKGTAFVIGARGFVGSTTVRALLARGWAVHCFGLPMEPDMLADLRDQIGETEGSVENTGAMARAMTAAGATAVFNFAAFSSGDGGLAKSGEADADRAFEINVVGLRRSFDAALEAGVERVIWSSSTTLYGPATTYAEDRIAEDAPPRPQGVYGLTKAMGEQLSLFYRDRHGLETSAVRLPLVVGPGLWYRGAASAMVGLVQAARPGGRYVLRGPEDPIDLMYSVDCGEALVAIAEHAGRLPERININGFTTNYPEIGRAAEAAVPGFDVTFEAQAMPVVYPLIRTELLQSTVGFRPRFGLAEAMRDFISIEGELPC